MFAVPFLEPDLPVCPQPANGSTSLVSFSGHEGLISFVVSNAQLSVALSLASTCVGGWTVFTRFSRLVILNKRVEDALLASNVLVGCVFAALGSAFALDLAFRSLFVASVVSTLFRSTALLLLTLALKKHCKVLERVRNPFSESDATLTVETRNLHTCPRLLSNTVNSTPFSTPVLGPTNPQASSRILLPHALSIPSIQYASSTISISTTTNASLDDSTTTVSIERPQQRQQRCRYPSHGFWATDEHPDGFGSLWQCNVLMLGLWEVEVVLIAVVGLLVWKRDESKAPHILETCTYTLRVLRLLPLAVLTSRIVSPKSWTPTQTIASEEREPLLAPTSPRDPSPSPTFRPTSLRSPTRSISAESMDVFYDAMEESFVSTGSPAEAVLAVAGVAEEADGSVDTRREARGEYDATVRAHLAVGVAGLCLGAFLDPQVYILLLKGFNVIEERACIVPPWLWVSTRGIWHGWASIVDCVLVVGSAIGVWGVSSYVREVFLKVRIEWIPIPTKAVSTAAGLLRNDADFAAKDGSASAWALIEVQGSVDGAAPGARMGTVHFDENNQPLLQVGRHRLKGVRVPLDMPFAVLRRQKKDGNSMDADCGNEGRPHEVVCVVRFKYLFKERPVAVLSETNVGLSGLAKRK
ncbi:hypothetical protein BC830DRAFT_1228834 [Chytriomyces sp. MP71]|nr:hypothetical protein BC830DRAFT_1228834 [Chytriomyces sp. MP71]